MGKIGPFGITELLIILAVILLIFGPKNLPKLGSALGKTVKNLREGMGGDKKVEEEKDEITEAEASEEESVKKEATKEESAAKKKNSD